MSLCSLGSDLSSLASSVPDLGRYAFSGDASISGIASGILGVTSAANAILEGVAGDVFSLSSQIPGIAGLDSEINGLAGAYASASSSLNSIRQKAYVVAIAARRAEAIPAQLVALKGQLAAKVTSLKALMDPAAAQARVTGGMKRMKSKFSSIKGAVATIGGC